MYAIISLCIGVCTSEQHAPTGLLLFTSLHDCQASIASIAKFEEKTNYIYEKTGVRKSGIKAQMEADLGYRYQDVCGRIFFADYAQTERLIDGRVTCSYKTRMPVSVMARRLDPYPDEYCHTKKPATSKPEVEPK